ncbi:MAG: hypothetical protein AAFV87_10495 [Pseudomonadota bacterium]
MPFDVLTSDAFDADSGARDMSCFGAVAAAKTSSQTQATASRFEPIDDLVDQLVPRMWSDAA